MKSYSPLGTGSRSRHTSKWTIEGVVTTSPLMLRTVTVWASDCPATTFWLAGVRLSSHASSSLMVADALEAPKVAIWGAVKKMSNVSFGSATASGHTSTSTGTEANVPKVGGTETGASTS